MDIVYDVQGKDANIVVHADGEYLNIAICEMTSWADGLFSRDQSIALARAILKHFGDVE